MSENPEDDFLSKWREAWKTEEGKDRLMHFFRRVPRLPAPGQLAQWRPLIPEPEPKHDGTITYGDLGKGIEVFHDESWGMDHISIRVSDKESVSLPVKQFLSLLDWGEQNRETLEQLAKEQKG